MDEQVIYDSHGRAALRLLRNGNLIDYKNRYQGFIKRDVVYDFNGTQRGWFSKGVLRDLQGACVGFTGNATPQASPVFPVISIPPVPSVPSVAPIRPVPNVPYVRPVNQIAWSRFNPISLFMMHL